MKTFLKKGILYFLMIQLSVLVAMLLTLLFIIPIRMVVKYTISQLWIIVVLNVFLEIAAIAICFRREKTEEKTLTPKKLALPLVFSGCLHFLLAFINGFYMYTAGTCVSETGIIWQSYNEAYIVKDMREVEIFRLIIPFLIALVIRMGAAFLGYYIGKKKNEKPIEN